MHLPAVVLLAGAVVLGGGTRPGFVSDGLLQLLSLPILLHWLWLWRKAPASTPTARLAVALTAAIVLLPIVQLVPLPASIVAWLAPARTIAELYQTLGQQPSLLPISISPRMTALAALSLLPSVTLFLIVQALPWRQRRLLVFVLVALTLMSILLGFAQLAAGSASRLRPYDITNYDDAVGFFANRNHFAALAYCCFVYTAAFWPADGGHRIRPHDADLSSLPLPGQALKPIILLTLFALLVAVATARSRGGILLMLLALPLSAVAILPVRRTLSKFKGNWLWIAVATVLVLVVLGEVTAYRIVERFTGDPLQDSRLSIGRNTWQAVKTYFPAGSGFGTFTLVYPMFQGVRDEYVNAFANRAHDDVLEVILEGGAIAVLVAAVVCAWIAWRCRQIWRLPARGSRTAAHVTDGKLEKAATIVVGLLLLHSLFDYPLRTGALAAIMAMSLAFMVPAVSPTEIRSQYTVEGRRSQSARGD